MTERLLIYCGAIFVVSLAGGLIPLIRRWSDEWLHLFISFGAGIFLGVVFLHLLPEAMRQSESGAVPWLILGGFLLVLSIEKVLLRGEEPGYDQSHKVISMTALLGLSAHSVIAGIGLALGCRQGDLAQMIFISILAHKATAAFSLCTLFLLARLSRRKMIGMLLLFSLMTPAGALIIGPVLAGAGGEALSHLTALTTGTFMYVATADLLPEVFHTKEHRWSKLILLLIGIVAIGTFAD